MVKTDKTIIAIFDKIEGMERQNESFSTTKLELFNNKKRLFNNKKIVSIVSIVFKTFATRMAGGSGDEHNLLSCCEGFKDNRDNSKKTIFYFSFVFSETTLSFPKTALSFTTARACARWA